MALHSQHSREHFRNIKAIFEGFNGPVSPPRTRPGSPINRPNSYVDSHMRSKSYTNNPTASLETVAREPVDIPTITSAAAQPVEPLQRYFPPTPSPATETTAANISRLSRPGLTSPKPSWIGPQPRSRPASPGIMAQKVTITFSSPGLQPPVYITTSLSEPQWKVLEMGSSEDSNGDFTFSKIFLAQPGEYQYKFRLGPGDWWVCDESKEVVDDGMGNRNNHITVADQFVPLIVPRQQSVSDTTNAPHLSDERRQELQRHQDAELAHSEKHQAPLLPHESQFGHVTLELPAEDVPVQPSKPRQDTIALPYDGDSGSEADEEPSQHALTPLFRHETADEPPATEIVDHTPGVDEDEDQLDVPEDHAPLMSHETYLPTPSPQAVTSHAFPNLSLGSLPASLQPVVPDEADPNDKSLEYFPTTPEAIVHHIRRLSNRMPEDEVTELSLAGSPTPPSPPPMPRTTSQSPSLPSVQEDSVEEEVAEQEEQLQRPAAPYTPPKTPPFGAEKRHEHHHQKIAETDMKDEARHPVKLPHLLTEHAPKEAVAAAQTVAQTARSGGNSWEAMLGLALFVLIGALAAWIAIKVQGVGSIAKDGGATIVD